VGVDGSPPSTAALAWAVDEARLRSARLVVVHAHLRPDVEDARAALDAAVDTVGIAGVPADRLVVGDRPAPAILAAAASADLVVLGSRGHGAFTGMLLGSVSHHVSHHAPCPVVVVRDAATPSA
jgi:nucleotide-binding universal stress UspA family protein